MCFCHWKKFTSVVLLALLNSALKAQTISIEEYTPISTLVIPKTEIKRARYPFIDVHSHQNPLMSNNELEILIKQMDSINLRVMVNLSGGWGIRLKQGIENTVAKYPNRIKPFIINLNPFPI